MTALKVEQSVWIDAPRERVWRAITDPEQLSQWWAPMTWRIPSLEVGAEVAFGDSNFTSVATIGILDPPKRFGLIWKPETAWPEIDRYDIPPRTTYVLEEHEGGTQVTVTESGFEAVPVAQRQQRMDKSEKGYAHVLSGLKAVCEGASDRA